LVEINLIKAKMKKVSLLIISALTLGMFSCQNEEWSFPDFEYTSIYFPYQYPVRSLVIGDYNTNNEDDNNLRFLISARVGGMYKNNSDWRVNFEVNEALASNLITADGDTLAPLPSYYYTLNPVDHIIIPKGSFHGGVQVQLTDAFLDDPMSYKNHYVVPLSITSSTADTVLSGFTEHPAPNPHIAGNWQKLPKDFTLFAIKFVNNYHGIYLRRGQTVIKNSMGDEIETIKYRREYVEYDELFILRTTGRTMVKATSVLKASAGSPGTYSIELNFDPEGNCTVTENVDSQFPATGSGKFLKDGDEWGLKKRNAIYLNYQVTTGSNTYNITDTLVFRDKQVAFEEFTPVVIN
jgi:hypothetical protein